LGIDLGGGSLEAGIGTADHVHAVTSVALGTARLRGELASGEVLTPADRAQVVALTAQRIVPIQAILDRYPEAGHRAIASGGTVRALARLAMGLHRPTSTGSSAGMAVNQVELPAGQLHELADRLASLDLDARLALPGVQARRAPLLPIGALVLSTLVEHLGLRRLVVSDWGLREGAVFSALSLQSERSDRPAAS
jgi:exopolyphosphatase/guanosine-5'-triphosphate,3'-diphosphate pyrophosphatase